MPTPERCLLGRNITSTRRKRDAACFNSKGWQRVQGLNESCDCEEVGCCRGSWELLEIGAWTALATLPWLDQHDMSLLIAHTRVSSSWTSWAH